MLHKRPTIEAVAALKRAGINFATGVPDSWLRSVLETVASDKDFVYVPVANESLGYGVCAGAWLAGKKPCLIMENSGLRVVVETLARLSIHVGIPVLMMISYRGDMGETESWAVAHGKTMEPLLGALRIPYRIVRRQADLPTTIESAATLAFTSLYPTAVVIGKELS